MNTQAGDVSPDSSPAASIGGIGAAAAAVAALQTASSGAMVVNSMPQSAFEQAATSNGPFGGSFVGLPGFAGLVASAGSTAASLGTSPSMVPLQAVAPPPPPPPSPAAPSPAITPRASLAARPAGGAASLAQARLSVEDTNALLASMKVSLVTACNFGLANLVRASKGTLLGHPVLGRL